jgi:cobalamin biosynthesis protein CobD/CbiB
VKKKVEAPKPDLKGATAAALEGIANFVEARLTSTEIFGETAPRGRTKAEWTVLEEARKLAVNYIRMGARQ